MSRKLTAQDKLALALTSAGSMRELARRMGVSHQKVGRWLREESPVPEDALTKHGIDAMFSQHRAQVRRQAKRHDLPYNSAAPVFVQRKPMRSGELGDRAFAVQTQFIKPELRAAVIEGATTSGRYASASVRSKVTLRSYFRQRAAEEIARRQRTDITAGRLGSHMLAGFIKREDKHRVHRIDPEQPFALYTRAMGLGLGDPQHAAYQVERLLQRKHLPATGSEGTELADQFLFQVEPEDDEDEDDEEGDEE